MGYSTGCHTTFHHRYHIVWAPKYRFKVLHGEVRLRVREIIKQVCAEMGVTIINGANLFDDLAHPEANFTMEHLEPVLRCPDDMVAMMKSRVTTGAVAHSL